MDHEVQTSLVELFGMANFAYPGQRLEVVELNYWKRRSTVIENASEVCKRELEKRYKKHLASLL